MAHSAEAGSSIKPDELDVAAKEVSESFAKLKAAIAVALGEWKSKVGAKETKELESRLVLTLHKTPSPLHAVSTEGVIATSAIFRMHLNGNNNGKSKAPWSKTRFGRSSKKEKSDRDIKRRTEHFFI